MSSVNLKRQKKINSQMNEVMDEFDRFEYFFATHWKKIVAVAVIAVIAVGVYAAITFYSKNNAEKANLAYSKAEDIAQLEAAVAQYKNPPAWVNLKLGTAYLEKKDYAKAVSNLKAAAKDASVPEIQWRAMLNLAAAFEMQKQYKEAAAEAVKVSKIRTVGSALSALEGYTAAARNYALAGDKVNATKTLEAAMLFYQTLPQEQRNQQEYIAYKLNFSVMQAESAAAPAAK